MGGHKSGSRLRDKYPNEISVTDVKLPICLSWSSRGVRAARAPKHGDFRSIRRGDPRRFKALVDVSDPKSARGNATN